MGIKTIEKIKEALGALHEMRQIHPRASAQVQLGRLLDLEAAVRDLIRDFTIHPHILDLNEGDSVTLRNSSVPGGRYWLVYLKEENPDVISIEVKR